MIDLNPEQIAACVVQATHHYSADAGLVAAVLSTKDGQSGKFKLLDDGTFVIGVAAIPQSELGEFAEHGVDAHDLAMDDCLNVAAAVFLIQRDIIAGKESGFTKGLLFNGQVSSAAYDWTKLGLPRRTRGPMEPCLLDAVEKYAIPLPIFHAVLATEGGRLGSKVRNRNGTYDLGPAQINTIHLAELRRFGITEQALIHDRCTNYMVAAYRLRSEINRVGGDLWQGVGNYHSRTKHFHEIYLGRVRKKLASIAIN